jgi:hypothetical protein
MENIVKINWPIDPGVWGYLVCLRLMVRDLQALNSSEVDAVLAKYKCDLVSVGSGVSLELP